MTDRAGRLGRRGLERLRTMAEPSSKVRPLRRRVEELEAEMQETRRLNRRLAELMDVVEELLVPISQRDEERVRQFLSSNTNALGGTSARTTGTDVPITEQPVPRDQSSGKR